MRDYCARNAQSDPTLSDVWLGEWLTVTVGETGGALSARILAANGHDPLAVECATKLEACVRREPPLVVELQRRTMFPDFR